MQPLFFKLLVLVLLTRCAVALMDFRHFALPNPPRMPTFADPGMRPPSYIFGLGQVYPPYDLDAPGLPEPQAGCDARYASVCAVQNSIRLVTRARVEVCPSLDAGGTSRAAALANVTADALQAIGAVNFGVFVLDSTGVLIADALRPDLIGEQFDGVKNAGMVPQSALLEHIAWVTSWGGGFVPHLTSRLLPNQSSTIYDPLDSGFLPQRASAYIEPCPGGDRIGVAFLREPIPAEPGCDSGSNSFCSQQNIHRLTGMVLVGVLNSHVHSQMEELYFANSYTTDYMVGNQYAALFHLAWWGYPGEGYSNPSPFEDTYTTAMSAGKLLKTASNGRNASNFLNSPSGFENLTVAEYVQWKVGVAWEGGGFMEYLWYSPGLDWHHKVSNAVGWGWNDTGYVVVSGLVHQPDSAVGGALCSDCPIDQNLPCAIQNVERLTAHAVMEASIVASDWQRLSTSPWFGSMHEGRSDSDGDFEGTWPWGFTVSIIDFNGTCIVDGRTASNIGLDASAIFGSSETHERFKEASAAQGGSWLDYELPDGRLFVARVVELARAGHLYYLFSAFQWGVPDWVEECHAEDSEACSEQNAQALVGMAATELLIAKDQPALLEVATAIANQTGFFSENFAGDYSASVFTDDYVCFVGDCGGAASKWPPSWFEALRATSFRKDGGWLFLEASTTMEATYAFVLPVRWSSSIGRESQELRVVTMIGSTMGRPHCVTGSDCGNNADCVQGHCSCHYGYLLLVSEDPNHCGDLPTGLGSCYDARNKVCDENGECSVCPAGYYCPQGEALLCPGGYYCPEGLGRHACPLGTVNEHLGATNESWCRACPAGTYNEHVGYDVCQLCEPGKMSYESKQSACERCPIGTYQEAQGSSFCIACSATLTTSYLSSSSVADCVCPEGTYLPAHSGLCQGCPDGIQCSSDNCTEIAIPLDEEEPEWPIPMASSGFMALTSNPLEAYRCKDGAWCPGGKPGTCAFNRDSTIIGCSKCLPHHHSTKDGTCQPCMDQEVLAMIVVAGILVCVALTFFAVIVNRNQLAQSNAMLVVVISLGLTVSALQTLTTFSTLAVAWREPLVTLFKAVAFVSFDLSVLRVECLMGQSSVSNFLLRQLVGPCTGLYIALVVLIQSRFIDTNVDLPLRVVNSVGAVFQIFFVAVVLSALSPLICFSHPNGLGHSMVNDPAVLCNQTGDHRFLLVVSGVALVSMVIPFVVTVLWATVRYRAVMADSERSRKHLLMFRFLFFRYNPESYYYGSFTLIRGLLICLVPVVFRDSPSMQLLSMASLLLGFCVLQLYTNPWRGRVPNAVDGVSNVLLVLMIVCFAMMSDFSDSADAVGIMAVVVLGILFLCIWALIVWNVRKYLRPHPYYRNFICHAKADASAQARYVQILLLSRARTSCFLDSDHLTNLEELFDVVRSYCRRLIVYLTNNTLRRPWCAGEITISWQTHKRVAAIVHHSFVLPTAGDLQAVNIQGFLASADFNLIEYGITAEYVSQAYRWLLYDLEEKHEFPTTMAGRRRFEAVVDLLISSNSKMAAGCSNSGGSTLRPGALVVSTCPGDDEATAAAGILIGKIQEQVMDTVAAGPLVLADVGEHEPAEVSETVLSAHAVVMILSSGTFSSNTQLRVLIDASAGGVTTLPVSLPNFSFPGQRFFEVELPERFGEQAPGLEVLLRSFLKRIAVPLTTYASQQVLDAQARSIELRIPRRPVSQRSLERTSGESLSTNTLADTPTSPMTPSRSSLSYLSSKRGLSSKLAVANYQSGLLVTDDKLTVDISGSTREVSEEIGGICDRFVGASVFYEVNW